MTTRSREAKIIDKLPITLVIQSRDQPARQIKAPKRRIANCAVLTRPGSWREARAKPPANVRADPAEQQYDVDPVTKRCGRFNAIK
jgi:hypothetical protein